METQRDLDLQSKADRDVCEKRRQLLLEKLKTQINQEVDTLAMVDALETTFSAYRNSYLVLTRALADGTVASLLVNAHDQSLCEQQIEELERLMRDVMPDAF